MKNVSHFPTANYDFNREEQFSIDALQPRVDRFSANTILTLQNKYVLVFHWEGFKCPSFCREAKTNAHVYVNCGYIPNISFNENSITNFVYEMVLVFFLHTWMCIVSVEQALYRNRKGRDSVINKLSFHTCFVCMFMWTPGYWWHHHGFQSNWGNHLTLNTLEAKQNVHHFADGIVKFIYMNENDCILSHSFLALLKFIINGAFNDDPFSERMMS